MGIEILYTQLYKCLFRQVVIEIDDDAAVVEDDVPYVGCLVQGR